MVTAFRPAGDMTSKRAGSSGEGARTSAHDAPTHDSDRRDLAKSLPGHRLASGRTSCAMFSLSPGSAWEATAWPAHVLLGATKRRHGVAATASPTRSPPCIRRPIIFLAFGVLIATSLGPYRAGEELTLYVCENGFIAVNPPLTRSRIGATPRLAANVLKARQYAGAAR